MSNSKTTDYACYLCKKVKFFKTFDNLLKHNCRFHDCEKEIINKKIKETMDEKILRLIPNVGKMFFVCVNALKKINKQIINKEYKLKTYIKIELNEPVFIHLDEPIFIEKIVTETIEDFDEIIIVKEDAIFNEQNVIETIKEFDWSIIVKEDAIFNEQNVIENITDEMIKENFFNEYENIISDDEVIFIDGQCYKFFDSPQDYNNLKKKVYFKLSKKYHPDKNSQKDCLYYTEYFKKLNYYYEDCGNITFFDNKNNSPSSSWMNDIDFDSYMNFFDKEDIEKYYNDYDYYVAILEKEKLNGKRYLNKEQIYKKVDKEILRDTIDPRKTSMMIAYFITYGEDAFMYNFFKKNFFISMASILIEDETQSDFYIKYRGEKARDGYISYTLFTGNLRKRKQERKRMQDYYNEELDRLIKLIENDYVKYINDEDFNYDLNFYNGSSSHKNICDFFKILEERGLINHDNGDGDTKKYFSRYDFSKK